MKHNKRRLKTKEQLYNINKIYYIYIYIFSLIYLLYKHIND